MLAALSDDDEDDDDDEASVGGGGVSLTSVLSPLDADGGCVDPDADDVLPIVHHQHSSAFPLFRGHFLSFNICSLSRSGRSNDGPGTTTLPVSNLLAVRHYDCTELRKVFRPRSENDTRSERPRL